MDEHVLPSSDERQESEIPYTVVSSDSHAGPSVKDTLRPYCPKKYLTDYDEYEKSQGAFLGTMQYFGDPENIGSP
jgi:hypothetical protein